MAIKAGNLIHAGNGGVLIERLQSGGPGQLNIPATKIYELGNYKAVGTVYDTPALTFTLNSTDVSTDVERWMTNARADYETGTMTTTAAGTAVVGVGTTWVVGQVGEGIVIPGAGTAGVDYVGTIATWADATHITVTPATPTAVAAGTYRIYPGLIDLVNCVPVDVAGQFKAGIDDPVDPFAVISSAAIPFLYVSAVSYAFGLHSNATQQVTLNGDSIFYSAGSVYIESAAGTGAADQTVITAHAAMLYDGDGNVRRVLAVEVAATRLTLGVDYTETYGSITDDAAITTVTLAAAVVATDTIRIVYASPDEAEYLQSVHTADLTVKPAAVRGKDIEIFIGGYDPNDVAGSQANKMTGVQSVKLDWKVTLEKDEEFGNAFAVGQDFDVPDVTGSVDFKPRNPADFLEKIRLAAGVSDVNLVLGADNRVPLALDVVIRNPDTKIVCKRFHVPDARFTLPGYSGTVQQKLTVTLAFTSDAGTLQVAER